MFATPTAQAAAIILRLLSRLNSPRRYCERVRSLSHRQRVLAVDNRGTRGFPELLDESHVGLRASSSFVVHAQSADGDSARRMAPAGDSSAARPRNHARQQGHGVDAQDSRVQSVANTSAYSSACYTAQRRWMTQHCCYHPRKNKAEADTWKPRRSHS